MIATAAGLALMTASTLALAQATGNNTSNNPVTGAGGAATNRGTQPSGPVSSQAPGSTADSVTNMGNNPVTGAGGDATPARGTPTQTGTVSSQAPGTSTVDPSTNTSDNPVTGAGGNANAPSRPAR